MVGRLDLDKMEWEKQCEIIDFFRRYFNLLEINTKKMFVTTYLNRTCDINPSYIAEHFHTPRNNRWWLERLILMLDLNPTTVTASPHIG